MTDDSPHLRTRPLPWPWRGGAGLAAILLLTIAAGVAAQTGLPLPRFVSLRADEVNMRAGPGVRYPIEWTYLRAGLPVEITAEFDTWRKIRDWEGTEGWVHQSLLSGKRTVLVTGGRRTLRREPGESAPAVAHLESGVIGALERCRDVWCLVTVRGFEGWLRMGEFWGVYADEATSAEGR